MKKFIPIFIAVIFIAYVLLYVFIPLSVFGSNEPLMVKLIVLGLAAGAIGLIVAMIFTLKSRLKEIKEEDQDDLSKY